MLVVDDEPIIRQLLTDALVDLGYLVDTAVHGAEALDKLARQSFQAVVLDLMMPVMDGREFLSRLRAEVGVAKPPVVVLSAAPADQLRTAMELGASACIPKPFELDTIAAALTGVIDQTP